MATNRFSRKRVRARKKNKRTGGNGTLRKMLRKKREGFASRRGASASANIRGGFSAGLGECELTSFPVAGEDQVWKINCTSGRRLAFHAVRARSRYSGGRGDGKISPPCSPLMVVKIDDPGSLDRRHFSRGFKARTERRVVAPVRAAPAPVRAAFSLHPSARCRDNRYTSSKQPTGSITSAVMLTMPRRGFKLYFP